MTKPCPIQTAVRAAIGVFGLLAVTVAQAQTQIVGDHFNAGATGTNSSDHLFWANGAAFSADANYFKLSYSTSGTYAGYYNGAFTMTVLAATPANLGPVSNAPALGSFLEAKLTLVSAPIGGLFDFWLTGDTTPTYALNVGDSTGLIPISDISLGAGSPGADPFGHIHGRRASTTLPGDYIVSFQLFDTSANGPGNGPIYPSPSDPFPVDFRAVVVPEPAAAGLIILGFGGMWLKKIRRNRLVQMERKQLINYE
jgi:hypothetical protein